VIKRKSVAVIAIHRLGWFMLQFKFNSGNCLPGLERNHS
jgi:hypothetical protein